MMTPPSDSRRSEQYRQRESYVTAKRNPQSAHITGFTGGRRRGSGRLHVARMPISKMTTGTAHIAAVPIQMSSSRFSSVPNGVVITTRSACVRLLQVVSEHRRSAVRGRPPQGGHQECAGLFSDTRRRPVADSTCSSAFSLKQTEHCIIPRNPQRLVPHEVKVDLVTLHRQVHADVREHPGATGGSTTGSSGLRPSAPKWMMSSSRS